MRHLTRRKLITVLGAGCGAPALYGGFVEPRWLERSFTTCRLPQMTRPVRLLHLSDLHASPVVPQTVIEAAIEQGLDAKPDLVAVTGDFITFRESYDRGWYRSVLRRLPARAPTFGCLGNHDGGGSDQIASLVLESGIRLLHNASESITVRGQRLQLAGVADLWSAEFDAFAAFATVDAAKQPVIFLAHNPDTKDQIPKQFNWDLMLSGHTHGGQVCVTGMTELMTPVRDKRYLAGLKPWNGRLVYVTRGVGNIGGIRFNCRPEISILDLTP